MTTLTFLGTGNYVAPGRYWNSFVVDGTVLMEPSPSCLPNLRRAGIPAADITTVFISHFHADHTFGWPFLLLELLQQRAGQTLHVVGPPGVEQFLADMMVLGNVRNVWKAAKSDIDMRFVEAAEGGEQKAGDLMFRAVQVEHVPYLQCFGYVLDPGGRALGYTGDVRPCEGLEELARSSRALVLECNGEHPPPVTHMTSASVAELRARHPGVPFILTHIGEDPDVAHLDQVIVPEDFQVIDV